MGVSQIEMLMTNFWQQTPTRILIRIALDDILLEIGIISQLTKERIGLKYVTMTSWIKHVLWFIVDYHIIDMYFKNEIF
jgi:hypothetical protein